MTAHSNWTHPRFPDAAAGPAAGKDDWHGMATEAAACLARREATYPDLVGSGKLDAATAEADLAAWREIAADWNWIATGDGDAPELWATRFTLRARIAALDTAIARFLTGMDRNGGATNMPLTAQEQITRLAAMRWWADREQKARGKLHARDFARIGQELHRGGGILRSIAAMEPQAMRSGANGLAKQLSGTGSRPVDFQEIRA